MFPILPRLYQKEEGRRKKEEGRRKKEEGRRKKKEERRKKEEGRSDGCHKLAMPISH
ncbi:hypothetical protein [Tychonema sp. LEGE 07196]|uniref:hypothetical protein n=1 Tax=Tychonema sp. LEGE 07196 TaxID=1828665 RepID=UPI00187E4AB1|nr:hypothetical protein [Tychonema sp. LEGE 07196]